MKNLSRAVAIMGTLAGVTSLASLVMVGCSGDDTSTKDGGPDVTMDNQQPDGMMLDGTMDMGLPDADGGTVNLAVKFKSDVAQAFCTRYQGCCNTIDAGPFDFNKCVQTAGLSAWNGSSAQLNDPEVLNGPNVKLDPNNAQKCLASLATLSCPVITSSGNPPEFKTLTDACYLAVVGTLNAGQACINSQECQATQYCKFAGVPDAGKSDGGKVFGQCATLISQGGLCGQAPPYGDPAYTSEECGYRGWQSTGNFCNYDTYPDAGGYKCTAERNNGDSCFADTECKSGMCGDLAQDCINTVCQCLTSRDYTSLCTSLKIKDAGPG